LPDHHLYPVAAAADGPFAIIAIIDSGSAMVATATADGRATDDDLRILHRVTDTLPLLADVMRCDALLYTRSAQGDSLEVAVDAKPQTVPSIYQHSLRGSIVERDQEPAVFRVFSTGRPVRRLTRQLVHGVPTEQDVWPILKDDRTIAVLSLEVGML